MDVYEPGESQEPPAINMNLERRPTTDSDVAPESEGSEILQFQSSNPHRVHSNVYAVTPQGPEADGEGLDPQCRSLSMDSAYGTLSPESLLTELPHTAQSEGEETEEEEGDGAGQEEDQEEGDVVEEEQEEEEEEEDAASLGSQLSVVQSSKPRRRPHVHPQLHCLHRFSSLSISRSEDNLLQRLHSKLPLTKRLSLTTEEQDGSEHRDVNESPLAHSKSLSELEEQNCSELLSTELDQSDDCRRMSLPSDKVCASLKRAEARNSQRTSAQPRGGSTSPTNSSDGEITPSAGVDRTKKVTTGEESGETSPKKRKSSAQQHKKLTLAQLYKIRTTLVLNSTLTAS